LPRIAEGRLRLKKGRHPKEDKQVITRNRGAYRRKKVFWKRKAQGLEKERGAYRLTVSTGRSKDAGTKRERGQGAALKRN